MSLARWRSDETSHELQISVRNDTDTPVRYRDVQLVTGAFATLPPTRMGTTLARTPRTDLRVPRGEARRDPATIPPVRPATVVAGERRYLIAAPPAPVRRTFLSYAQDVCGAGGS